MLTLPLRRAYRRLRTHARRLQTALARLSLMPASSDTRLRLTRHDDARAAATRALTADANNATAWHSLGDALWGLGRDREATRCYDRALALAPDSASIWRRRFDGTAARAAIRQKATRGYIDNALALNPKDADALAIHAGAHGLLLQFAEGSEAADRALILNPSHTAAARVGIHCRLHACDWRRRDVDKSRIAAGIKGGERIVTPFDHRSMCDSEEESLIVARRLAGEYPLPQVPIWKGDRYRHDKIRIAYISTDFRSHAVASLIVGCFEHHDNARFEPTAISLRPDDGSRMRRRIEASFDRFISAQTMNDVEVAAMLREMEVDIAVDLNGHTGARRIGIFAHRPAPVQVSFLGYPGTTGAPFIDYIVADRMVIPDGHQVHYSEKVVYLPHAYLPSDRNRRIAEKTPSRAESGLPEAGFVFACFNNTHKIGPEMFDVWMRLLRVVEGSVLWLRAANPAAMANLQREAVARGVSPDRLVFAQHVPRAEDHFARLRAADLFLDTLPYNAHTTAIDALWAGLPVLTCPGNTFPARVAASLLYAVGMPELAVSSLTEYEDLARTLARDPERLAALKATLMRNRDTEPLFDTARFTRDLESVYTTMCERQQAGLPPASFAVPRMR